MFDMFVPASLDDIDVTIMVLMAFLSMLFNLASGAIIFYECEDEKKEIDYHFHWYHTGWNWIRLDV